MGSDETTFLLFFSIQKWRRGGKKLINDRYFVSRIHIKRFSRFVTKRNLFFLFFSFPVKSQNTFVPYNFVYTETYIWNKIQRELEIYRNITRKQFYPLFPLFPPCLIIKVTFTQRRAQGDSIFSFRILGAFYSTFIHDVPLIYIIFSPRSWPRLSAW